MIYISSLRIRRIVQYLRQGQIIAYPTEAVYGLGCDPLNQQSVLELLRLKQRPVEKGLILIASDIRQLEPYVVLDNTIRNKVTSTWPGPVTWVIPTRPGVPEWLTGNHQTLAVRVTAHPLAKMLCDQFDSPLVSTSANLTGKRPACSAIKVRKDFLRLGVHVLTGKLGDQTQTSSIFDAVSGQRLR